MLLYNKNHYSIHAYEGTLDEDLQGLIAEGAEDVGTMEAIELDVQVDFYSTVDPNDGLMFVLYKYDEPVGLLACYRIHDMAVAEHFYILPEYRDFHLVKQMLTYFKHWARCLNCTKYTIGDEVRELKHGH